MDRKTLIRKTRIVPGSDGPMVAFALDGEIGVLSCAIHMNVKTLQRVGSGPYRGEMHAWATVETHRHYPRNPREKRRQTTCDWLSGNCYGTGWIDNTMAVRYLQGEIDQIWHYLELAYERWWRNVKEDSETEDFYLEEE